MAGWWINLRFFWHTFNRGPWIAGFIFLVIATSFGVAVRIIDSNQSQKRELSCLALNIYYEARGESIAGMYAVAEVTMNRVMSGRHPETVCGVVYQKKWDRLRKRQVSAFSWTEFNVVPHPEGPQWQQAREIAEAVYFGRQPPALEGALHYHASYIRPSWSKGQKPITRIGGHIFYK